ncbi:succinylglutamate desuccinylase [Corallincola spongiicola]|uniref:Succinylglutamate desuccinylase n=1 Tax=Corallincola spongiicola TaxID=2520508 RepID=A0ABY1WUL3_9GAMM|nr:succinylglutamate desuccinylase [Corallincola spongiicola]
MKTYTCHTDVTAPKYTHFAAFKTALAACCNAVIVKVCWHLAVKKDKSLNAQHLLDNSDFLTELLSAAGNDSAQLNWQHRGVQYAWLGEGILLLEPLAKAAQTDLVLSCGIHGNETAPIEICNRLVNAIVNGTLTLGVRLLVIVGNIPAMKQGTRFVDENLNRLFKPEQLTGDANQEQCRATELMTVLDQFYTAAGAGRRRIHLDLHTAIRGSKHEKFAVHPFLHGQPYCADFIQLLAALECSAILLSHEPTGTFSYFSSRQYAAQAATVELGKVKLFGENRLQDYLATEHVLQELIAERFSPSSAGLPSTVSFFQVCRSIHKLSDEFHLSFADDIDNFTGFAKGERLCHDGDVSYVAEHEGEAIVFPNAGVAIGQRALLTLKRLDDPVAHLPLA